LAGKGLQPQLPDVEQELRDIFLHVRNTGELVLDSFNLDPGYGSPRQGTEKYPAHSVAQGGAEARLQRLSSEAPVVIGALNTLHTGDR